MKQFIPVHTVRYIECDIKKLEINIHFGEDDLLVEKYKTEDEYKTVVNTFLNSKELITT